MARPCNCNKDGCRLCWLANNDERYQRKWAQPKKERQPRSKKSKPSLWCKHLGELTGERVKCEACPGTAAARRCAVHGRCTVTRNTEGVPFCQSGCDKFEARESLVIDLTGPGYCRGLGDAITFAWLAAGSETPVHFHAEGGLKEILALFGQSLVEVAGVKPDECWKVETREKYARPRCQVWQEVMGMKGTPKRPPLPVEVKPAPGRIAIAPECNYPARTWPRERYNELAAALQAAGHEVVWILKEKHWSFERVAKEVGACSLLIGNDSMPAHMAGTLGVSALVLFGSTRPPVLAHYGDVVHPIDMGKRIELIPVQAVLDKAVELARPEYTEVMMVATFAEWEPWVAPFIPAAGKHALDIGGNVGQWARGLAKRFQRVTCLEPTPALAKRIADLALPNVAVLEKAAWISSGVLPFQVYGDTPHGFGIWSTVSGIRDRSEAVPEEITVAAVAIDSLGLDVDFIKVDVEGAEVPVLMGAATTIERCRAAILIECHEPEHFAWCVAFLDRHGYNVTSINGPGYTPETKDWAAHRWLFAKHYKCKGP